MKMGIRAPASRLLRCYWEVRLCEQRVLVDFRAGTPAPSITSLL